MIASCSQLLTLQAYTHGTPFSVCIDTGADCNLLSKGAYLKLKQLYNVPLTPCVNVFQAVQGSPLNILGSVVLPMSFHAQDYTFNAKFFVVTDFILKCDALIGYNLLNRCNISIFPAHHAIIFDDVVYTAMDNPVSLLQATSRRVHFEQSPHTADNQTVAALSAPSADTTCIASSASALCYANTDAPSSDIGTLRAVMPTSASSYASTDVSSSDVGSLHAVMPASAPCHANTDAFSSDIGTLPAVTPASASLHASTDVPSSDDGILQSVQHGSTPSHTTDDVFSVSAVDETPSTLPAPAPYNNFDVDSSVVVLEDSTSTHHVSLPCSNTDDAPSISSATSARVPTTPVESKRSVSTETFSHGTVEGEQYIGPTCASRVPIRVKDIPIGSYVLSLPDSIRVKKLALEGTLTIVRDGHRTDALVTNLTGSPITLKHGVHLGSFIVVDKAFFQDSPSLVVAAVSSQPAPGCNSAELATQLGAHLQGSDFPEAQSRLLDILMTHRQAIALPGEPLGVTDLVTHRIDLKPGTRPVYVPSYRLPHSQRKVAHDLVNGMLAEGIIQESYSPWNSPLFLVPKKDGSFRAVVDFRRVNDATVPDHYPLPVLQDLLQSIGKDNTVFSTLDLKSGFWQIPLDENSRHITAFSTPSGHYEWLRCPMGLRNSPLTCQRLINSIFQGLIGDGLFVYLDDLILVSRDLDSHLTKLALVLQKFADAGLKLNLPKCKFLRARIEFLGHMVDKDGIHTTPDKVRAVQNFPVPVSVNNVRSFLGLAGYYRAFIQDFAAIAAPLTRLLKKNVPFQWNDAQQRSFEFLKTALTHAPILAFPDYNLPFIICTDASTKSIGAVLMQQVEPRRPHVIAYASRTLNAAESHYSITHLEMLAVVWSLRHFRDIIYGYDITVYTDHTAVTQLFKGKNLSGRLARWFLTIDEFRPTIKYLPGRANHVADALSRNVAVAAVTNIQNFSLNDLAAAQRSDPLWSPVIYALESGDDVQCPQLPVPLTQFDISNDVLCRNVLVHDENVTQLMIPESLVPTILHLFHAAPQSGHPGRDKTLVMARRKYYWPRMRADITSHVSHCLSCTQTKGNTHTAPILGYPTPDCPFDTVAIDLLQLPRSSQGSSYVLVCVDHFSRFVILAPLMNKSAPMVAHALVTHLLCPYTTPSVLLSDNGLEFKNEILHNICKQYNIKQTFITAHHPASNGLVERTNRKILEILRHVAGQFQESWQDWLPHVAACINGSVNASTGKTPHYVIFGSEKRLPYDLLVQPRRPVYSLDDYSQNQLRALQMIHDSVRHNLQESRNEMLHRQHAKATPVSLKKGDVVFKSAPERQNKLTPKFTGPFMITNSMHGNKFKIFNPANQTSEVVHADRLKRSDIVIPASSLPSPVPVLTTSTTSITATPSHSYNLRSRTSP